MSSFAHFTCCSVYNHTLLTFPNYRYVGWGCILNSFMLTVCGHRRDEVMCIVSSAWGLICKMERNGTELPSKTWNHESRSRQSKTNS